MYALRTTAIATLIILSSAPASAEAASKSKIAAKIEAQVAEMIAGINTQNADLATKYDSPDLVFMESFSAPILGHVADRQGFIDSFKHNKGWHISRIDETVDVANSGDMAVYRGTYDEDILSNGVPMTHRVNYLAGFRVDPDGAWRVHWEVINPQTHSHKK